MRLEEDRLCCLVLVGVRPDGSKELVAVEDGYREDSQSWLDLLRELRKRGMQAPELAAGDGALGFWAALREVFPSRREQRCWVHKTANVLAALPGRVHAEAKAALQAVSGAPTRAEALDAARARLPRLPRRAPRAPAHDEPDRVDVRDGAAAPARDEGGGVAFGGAGDGLQAARRRATALAAGERTPARGGRPDGRRLRGRGLTAGGECPRVPTGPRGHQLAGERRGS